MKLTEKQLEHLQDLASELSNDSYEIDLEDQESVENRLISIRQLMSRITEVIGE